MWNQRVALIRLCAKKRKFEMARREWESLMQQAARWTRRRTRLDLLRAAVEYKANAVDVAEKYVAEAEGQAAGPDAGVDDPAHAGRPVRAEPRGQEPVRRPFQGGRGRRACRADTAGQMARILLPFVSKQIKYTGLATHQRLVMDYLQRCQGQHWTRDDLWYVVQFVLLSQSWRRRAPGDRLIGTGMGCFPQDPFSPIWRAASRWKTGRTVSTTGPAAISSWR